jgi:L-glyceraldehyde 3-phosphate reductase
MRDQPAATRYDSMLYRRCGCSGLRVSAISLGLWRNFGSVTPLESARRMVFRAFDLGINHFDLANNYGPPPGAAEENFGKILREDLAEYRDELIISTKAGYPMWPGPCGEWGSRKSLLASLDQSLRRMGLDYVDIFYSHRPDPGTPLEETLSALQSVVRQGKALYVGISSYSAARTKEAAAMVHQPSYSLLSRWVEKGLLDVLGTEGIGCIAFSPLAQGMLSDTYLAGVPSASRAAPQGAGLDRKLLTDENLRHIRALNAIARVRGQSLPQMAIAWVLRDQRVTSALIGASSPDQIAENVGALSSPHFTAEELTRIDKDAVEGGIDLWAQAEEVS